MGLDDSITFPLWLGTGTVPDGLFAPARHNEAHITQLEYAQRTYGKHDWHIGVQQGPSQFIFRPLNLVSGPI